jgi:hypothetical protein
MKKIMLIMLLSLLTAPAFAYEATLSAPKASKRLEVGLGFGSLLVEGGCSIPVGTIASVGYYVVPNLVQLEGNVASAWGDMVLSGNVSFNIPTNQRITPFGTIGLGTCIHRVPFFNIGGGAKISLTERIGIRAEYRRWIAVEEYGGSGLGSIFCGLTFSF